MAEVVEIDDPADPRIADYRDIRERDLAGRRGVFVIEGEVVLRAAVRAGRFPLVSALLAEKRVSAFQTLIDGLPTETPVYSASQAVMDAVVGFPIHRGVLAIGRRPSAVDAAEMLAELGPSALVLALVGIANHDNMGGLFRNAAAFGAGAVLLDGACCDPLYRKAIRVSVGAALTTLFARLPRAADVLDLLDDLGFETLALSPTGAARLGEVVRAPRVALMLGPEGPGLGPAILARTRSVAIPMAPGFDSLNVAVAAGVALHHLATRVDAVSRPGGG